MDFVEITVLAATMREDFFVCPRLCDGCAVNTFAVAGPDNSLIINPRSSFRKCWRPNTAHEHARRAPAFKAFRRELTEIFSTRGYAEIDRIMRQVDLTSFGMLTSRKIYKKLPKIESPNA